MLTRQQKTQIVEELKEKFLKAKAAFFVSFMGVDVKTSQELRKNLKKVEGEYKVAKKTLLERAVKMLDITLPAAFLQGQIGIVFDYQSEVNGVRMLVPFTKTSHLSILGGMIGERFLSDQEVEDLSLLPPLEVMRARFVSTLQSPMTRFVFALKGVQFQLIATLHAIITKKT